MSETTPEPIPTPCHGCGQTDTAPKIQTSYNEWQKDAKTIIVDPDFHFDCLPAEIRATLTGPGNANTLAGVEAAEAGTKGDALRDLLQSLPDDNNIEIDEEN